MTQVSPEKTVRKKVIFEHDDVGVNYPIQDERRDKYGDAPVHRKSYTEIVNFGKTGGVKL